MDLLTIRILLFTLSLLSTFPLLAGNGTGYVIERIEVRGNEKTKVEFIIRSLPLRQGDRITPGGMDASRESLYRTRLFRTVHVASKPGTEKGQAVLVVFVDEKRFGDIGASFEYTELDGFGLAVDAFHANLWGEGKTVGSEFLHGERLESWGFYYSDPWLTNSGLSLHLQTSVSSSDRDLYPNRRLDASGTYDLSRTGGSIGVGQTIGKSYRLIYRYTYDEVQIGSFVAPTIRVGSVNFEQEVQSSVGREPVAYLGLDFHHQPKGVAWGSSPGLDLRIQADYSSTVIGSKSNFLRLQTQIYRHFQALPGQIFSVGARAGTIVGTPPFYERFLLEGSNQLRGFEPRGFGSEGGSKFVSTEAIYSITMKPVGRLYVFGEWAAIRRTRNQIDKTGSDGTIGIGILLFHRVDLSFGIGTGTLIVKSHRFGGINVGL
jgi:outer membrane protein assembly factor BamA